jgi:hypothetical protein
VIFNDTRIVPIGRSGTFIPAPEGFLGYPANEPSTGLGHRARAASFFGRQELI